MPVCTAFPPSGRSAKICPASFKPRSTARHTLDMAAGHDKHPSPSRDHAAISCTASPCVSPAIPPGQSEGNAAIPGKGKRRSRSELPGPPPAHAATGL